MPVTNPSSSGFLSNLNLNYTTDCLTVIIKYVTNETNFQLAYVCMKTAGFSVFEWLLRYVKDLP